MSNNDKNLLNFLKQNSLFTNSPSKNGLRKSKSRSKDKNESKGTPTKPRDAYLEDPYQKTRSFAPQDNYRPQDNYKPQGNFRPQDNYRPQDNFRPQDNYRPQESYNAPV